MTKILKLLCGSLLGLAGLFVSGALAAAPPAMPPPIGVASIPLGPQTLFALPAGTVCPGGSTLYRGPEAKLAARDKMIYCLIARQEIMVFKKTATLNACPPMSKPYVASDVDIAPDTDVLWCRRLEPGDAMVPPPVPQSNSAVAPSASAPTSK
jgi:hypothetical protein